MRKTTTAGLVWLVASVPWPQGTGLGKPGLAWGVPLSGWVKACPAFSGLLGIQPPGFRETLSDLCFLKVRHSAVKGGLIFLDP